jgi:hypothetical protein
MCKPNDGKAPSITEEEIQGVKNIMQVSEVPGVLLALRKSVSFEGLLKNVETPQEAEKNSPGASSSPGPSSSPAGALAT